MNDSSHPFRYRLAPLLRRDEWERDLLGGELQRARILCDQSRRRWEAAEGQVHAAETHMRELHAQDRTIELDARRLLHAFIEHAHVHASARLAEFRKASTLMEQVQSQFDAKRLAVRALEKHRDRQAESHRVEQGRQVQRAADDAWIAREGRR